MIKSILLLTILIASLTASAQSKITSTCYDKTRPLSFVKGQVELPNTKVSDNIRVYIVSAGQENGYDHYLTSGLQRCILRGGSNTWSFDIPFTIDTTKSLPWMLLYVNGNIVDKKQLSVVGCN